MENFQDASCLCLLFLTLAGIANLGPVSVCQVPVRPGHTSVMISFSMPLHRQVSFLCTMSNDMGASVRHWQIQETASLV
ncbi:hypothetical protein QBC46DRAFT_393825 [Diplogelasinospora grovesii]|uniref:Uncharacterized protein n=1 Tax=Diplogelasinospora grovesii TaxID=303347 RepID=A0AAN6S0R2_9PEZI|nr:hypothetical protein QBC46DRAFT_393825 [Diplogelasinospora grovesii]